MSETEATKVLGVAEYEARWIQRSFMVRLTAKGILPCCNYEAQLEKRPERVIPPMWDMVFFVENVCMEAVKFFEVEAVILNAAGAKTISVRDATGEHEVPIQEALSARENSTAFKSAADLDLFIVYGKLPKIDGGHHGCIVVPADSFVTAIHYRAFGPASKAECDEFLLKNCIAGHPKLSALSLPGGEIPWPLLPE